MKYFIERKEKSIVTDQLFGLVEKWDVVETVEYSTKEEWMSARQQIGIPDACWLEKGNVSWKAYVEGV